MAKIAKSRVNLGNEANLRGRLARSGGSGRSGYLAWSGTCLARDFGEISEISEKCEKVTFCQVSGNPEFPKKVTRKNVIS